MNDYSMYRPGCLVPDLEQVEQVLFSLALKLEGYRGRRSSLACVRQARRSVEEAQWWLSEARGNERAK